VAYNGEDEEAREVTGDISNLASEPEHQGVPEEENQYLDNHSRLADVFYRPSLETEDSNADAKHENTDIPPVVGTEDAVYGDDDDDGREGLDEVASDVENESPDSRRAEEFEEYAVSHEQKTLDAPVADDNEFSQATRNDINDNNPTPSPSEETPKDDIPHGRQNDVDELDSHFVDPSSHQPETETTDTFLDPSSSSRHPEPVEHTNHYEYDEAEWDDFDGDPETTWDAEQDTASNESSTTLSSRTTSKRTFDEADIEDFEGDDQRASPPTSPGAKRARVQ